MKDTCFHINATFPATKESLVVCFKAQHRGLGAAAASCPAVGTWKAWKPAVKAGGDSPIVGWKFWKMGIFIRGRRSLALELEEANLDQRHSSSLCCLGDFWLLSKL